MMNSLKIVTVCSAALLIVAAVVVTLRERRSVPLPEVPDAVSPAVNPWRFSSEYAEDDIATVYYNYRHYEPVMGRWLSRDPIDEKGGELLYVYSGNSLRIDRLGMSWMDWKDLIPGPINTILSAKDCVISLYNWSLGVKEHVKDAYNDKYLHCRASCEFSQDCGTKISAALGVIKEVGDLLGHTFELIRDLFDDSNTVGEDFEWYLKWLADSGTDLLADGEGIACEWSGSDCECCCAESHDRYTERKK